MPEERLLESDGLGLRLNLRFGLGGLRLARSLRLFGAHVVLLSTLEAIRFRRFFASCSSTA
jgi:hypothetical protein